MRFRYYLLALVLLPILFYIPKFFEVRAREVILSYQAIIDCTGYVEFREEHGIGFQGLAQQSMVNRNFTKFPRECHKIPIKYVILFN